MSKEQLKELGYQLTGLNVTFDKREGTLFRWETWHKLININCLELDKYFDSELRDRGYSKTYLTLQALLHEIAYYKQFLKYGKGFADIFEYWILGNKEKVQDTADRYALMYYRRFLKEF